MSGLDKIISRLESDCSDECDKIMAYAQMQAAQMIVDAKKTAQEKADEIISNAEKTAELISKKADSSASLNDRRMILEAKVAMVDETLALAVKKLRTLDERSYFGVLTHLVKKYKRDEQGILFLSAADLKRMPGNFCVEFADIEISRTPIDIEDGFILKYGDIEINCTFGSMLNAAMDDLKAVAVDLLFN